MNRIKSINGEVIYEITSTTQRHKTNKCEEGCDKCHDRCELGIHMMGLYAHEYEVK